MFQIPQCHSLWLPFDSETFKLNDHTCVCYFISKSSVVSQDQIGALLTKFQYAIDIPDGPVWEAMNYASNHGSGWVPRFDETDPPATRRQFTYQKSSEKYTKTQTSTQELPRNYPGMFRSVL